MRAASGGVSPPARQEGLPPLHLVAIGLVLIAAWTPPAGALTPAGTVITGIATASFEGGTAVSDPARFVVAQAAGVGVVPAAGLGSGRAGQTCSYPVAITNLGNGPDTFTLAAASSRGWGVTIYRDQNGDGVHQASETGVVSTTGSLAAGARFLCCVAVTVPAGATGGDTAALTAVSSFDATARGSASYTTGVIVRAPVAAFSGAPTAGAVPLAVQFADASVGSPTSWAWSFGDGTTSSLQSPGHSYTSPGSFTVNLTAANANGADTLSRSGYITASATTPLPRVTAVTLSRSSIALGETVDISVTVANAGLAAAASGLDVSFPALTASADGPRATRVSTGWGSYGTYAAGSTLWTKSGGALAARYLLAECSAPGWAAGLSRALTLRVQPKATGTFTINVRAWMMSTGGAAHVAPGSSSVTDQQGWPVSQYSVVVAPASPGAPTASFSGTPTSGAAPLTVQFTDTSTGTPTAWAWAFGDGVTSTARNPSRQYTGTGRFTVSLTAANASGANTVIRSGYITVSATAPIPSITAVTSSQSSITLGQIVDLTVTVVNNGAAAGESGIDVSLPALSGSGDAANVSQVTAGWGTYREYAAGSTLWTRAGATLSAQYLLAELSDAGWGAGISRTFTVRVQPKAAGTFTCNVRAWMMDAAGATSYVDPGASGAQDQQGWPVAQCVVTVR